MAYQEKSKFREKVEEKRQKMIDTLLTYIETNPTSWESGWYRMPSESPINGKTQKKYNGLNAFYLSVIAAIKGYSDPRWITYNQAQEMGANVKSGEKSSEVFYWNWYDKKTKKPFEESTLDGMTKDEAKQYRDENVRPVMKFYQVFNANQCNNMPEYVRDNKTPEMELEERSRQVEIIERVIANSAAPVHYDGENKAYYSPRTDSIHLPEIERFKSMQDFYATALHEIAHSTGHKDRLNREISNGFGSPNYAREELRAELASVFMQVELGISVEGRHFENHGAYLASWLKAVKNNNKEFFAAAADAERIADYVSEHYAQEQRVEEVISTAEPIFEPNSSFAKQVDAVLSGADTTSTHLKVMSTPLILRQLGASNLPILMTAKHLKNIVATEGNDENVNYHGLDADIIKKLPELIADPVMVMDSLTRDDSVVVLTATVDSNNRPIIGAIKFDGIGNLNNIEISANILTSVYGRNNFNDFVQRNIDAGTVLYWDKEKSKELIKTPGIQFPDNLNSLATNTIIRKAKAFVNNLEQKSQNNLNVAENTNKKSDNIEQSQQVGQAEQDIYGLIYNWKGLKKEENTKESYILDFKLNYSNEMLLSNKLAKLGYKRDDSVFERNQNNDIVATEAGIHYWTNEIKYIGKDGRSIVGLYGRTSNGIIIEATDITRFTLNGIKQSEMEDIAKVLRDFGADVTIKGLNEQGEQSEQVRQTKQAQQVEQVKKWRSVELSDGQIGDERGKSTRINMSKSGEYASFVFFVPTKFIRKDEKTGLMQLSVNADFNYTLMRGNQRVELTGEELCQAMAGKVVGKRTQRLLSEENAKTLSDLEHNVPEEMRNYPNWCVFTTRWNEHKGKKDKSIYSPTLGLDSDGKMQWASIDKPETWTTFEAALTFAKENDCAGLVFALNGEGISCIDLDKAIVKDGKLNDKPTDKPKGTLSSIAEKLTSEMLDTYIETSASGNGIHIFVKDDILAKGKYKNRVETSDGEIEVYDEKRFISMTGNIRSKTVRLGKSPVATTSWLQGKLGEKALIKNNNIAPRKGQGIDRSDKALIERIQRSKSAADFNALFNGDNMLGDNSRSDFKLLNMLAFFSDCDAMQMERIFKESKLYRPEKGEQYVQRSVRKAIDTLNTRISEKALGSSNTRGNGGSKRGSSK